MKKFVCLLLALTLMLCGCATAAASETTVITVSPPETALPAPTQAPATTQVPAAPQAAPVAELAQGEARAYSVVPAIDPRAQAYHDSFDRGAEPMFTYDTVMQGNAKFFDVSAAEGMGLNTMLTHWSTGEAVSIRQLTVVDLDGGTPEIVLWLQSGSNSRYGFQVLRYDGGDVYGYQIPYQQFEQLKIDGTFLHNGGTGTMYFNGPDWHIQSASATQDAHREKADVIWFPDWMSFLYPGTPEPSDIIQGVLDKSSSLVDPQSQEKIDLSQVGNLLVPADITPRIVAQTTVDMDGDGAAEQVLQMGTEADDYLGYVVLKPQGDLVYCQSYYYRSFLDLKADGTFAFSSSASDRGYGKLSFQDGQWVGTVLAECHETTDISGSAHMVYFVGGQMTTAEAFQKFESTQDAKPAAAWLAPEG